MSAKGPRLVAFIDCFCVPTAGHAKRSLLLFLRENDKHQRTLYCREFLSLEETFLFGKCNAETRCVLKGVPEKYGNGKGNKDVIHYFS
jgi:hypothetical protein